jgi:hypothetical protein
MYKIKYYSSKNKSDISFEEQQHHKKYYIDQFDIDIDFNKSNKRPALKKSSKILINSPWGKHAESVYYFTIYRKPGGLCFDMYPRKSPL